MIKSEKKLEELIYFCLISNFESKHVKDGVTYISFCSKIQELENNQNNKPVCKIDLKPIYVTSDEEVGDKVLNLRMNAFENKIFSEDIKECLNKNFENGLYFSKRMGLYINKVYNKSSANEKQKILNNFETNLYGLYNFNIIDKKQFNICRKYISKQLGEKELSF